MQPRRTHGKGIRKKEGNHGSDLAFTLIMQLEELWVVKKSIGEIFFPFHNYRQIYNPQKTNTVNS